MNHVWSYDSVFDRTQDGRPLRMLTTVDEYTRECLLIDVGRRLSSENVLERLSDLFLERGTPTYIRSDNAPEFTAMAMRDSSGGWGSGRSSSRPRTPGRTGTLSP